MDTETHHLHLMLQYLTHQPLPNAFEPAGGEVATYASDSLPEELPESESAKTKRMNY